MAEYKTQQKQMLLRYLYQHRDAPVSVEEICEGLAETGGDPPGKSTVYRIVNRLCEEGSIKRFSPEGSRGAVYQLTEGEECHRHLHLRCTSCGRLLHMNRAQSARLLEEILSGNDFAVNQEDTTLLGVCGPCMRLANNGKKG